jgi:hypothetical protein
MRNRLGDERMREDDEETKPRVGKAGVELTMSCPHCSAFSPVLIEWTEIVALARGECPTGFSRTTTGHTFSLLCPRCSQHWKQAGKAFVPRPDMSPEEQQEALLRAREVSMVRPVGMEAVAKWLAAGRAYGFVR